MKEDFWSDKYAIVAKINIVQHWIMGSSTKILRQNGVIAMNVVCLM